MDDPDWKIPSRLQPLPERYPYDLDRALQAVVAVKCGVPSDAFTARTLGTDRAGNGALISRDGLVLTIGYLITEADSVWLTAHDGRVVPAHVVALDQASGFGLVQALGRLDLEPLELGESEQAEAGMPVVFAAAGGRHHAVRAQVVGRKPFAGYWEYLLEHPIFTSPAHPFWGGGALIGTDGKLLGIGSLIVQHTEGDGRQTDMNMIVPVELLRPILHDLLTQGRSSQPARPWLGLYCGENHGVIMVQSVSPGGPADRADVRSGDQIVAVGGTVVSDLTDLWRAVWASGHAGATINLTLARGRSMLELSIPSADRASFLRTPRLH